MTSGGKRCPAKAELGAGRTGGCRRDLIARVSLMPTPAANEQCLHSRPPTPPRPGSSRSSERRRQSVPLHDLRQPREVERVPVALCDLGDPPGIRLPPVVATYSPSSLKQRSKPAGEMIS